MDSNSPFKIKKMSPQLLVADIQAAIDFYQKKLGFEVEFEYEDFYAGLMKDGCSIHIKAGEDRVKGERKIDAEDLDIVFFVEEIDKVYEQLVSRGITVIQPLREMPYGKEFYIADQDGNILSFME